MRNCLLSLGLYQEWEHKDCEKGHIIMQEAEVVVDLEEAVGSYLNCLSTSCAAGSKLYASVGKIIDEKFNEIFPNEEELNSKLVKTRFQSLQTQNAFEGYQKALLDCKEKLLEILIDNHTKKQNPSKEGKNKNDSSGEQVIIYLFKTFFLLLLHNGPCLFVCL